MQILKRWTAEALYRAWDAGVSRFFWFSLRDFPPNDLIFSVSVQSGLYFRGTTVAAVVTTAPLVVDFRGMDAKNVVRL